MPSKRALRAVGKVVLFVTVLGLFVWVTQWVPIQTIIDSVGTSSALLTMFVVAMVGGVTTFSGVPYELLLISLAYAGINPWLLGVVAATGILLGDSVSYVIGRQGGSLFSPRVHAFFMRISLFLETHPRLVFPGLVLYGAFSPFSNDFIMLATGLSGYAYVRTIIPLWLGNIVYHTILAYLGMYAYGSIMQFFS